MCIYNLEIIKYDIDLNITRVIDVVNNIKFLGIPIAKNLNWKYHNNVLNNKRCYALSVLVDAAAVEVV